MIDLRLNNPYSTGYVLNNYRRLYRNSLVYQPSPKDKFHIVAEGEELDAIAFRYYKDSKMYWVIYDINRETIPDPFILPIGTRLIIPYLNAYS